MGRVCTRLDGDPYEAAKSIFEEAEKIEKEREEERRRKKEEKEKAANKSKNSQPK